MVDLQRRRLEFSDGGLRQDKFNVAHNKNGGISLNQKRADGGRWLYD